MGASRAFGVVVRLAVPLIAAFALVAGCQMNAGPSTAKLVEYREKLDDTGLAETQNVKDVKITASFPRGWEAMGLQKAMLYTHQQWRSPTKHTAVGVTYVRMPIPLSTKTLVWFAMNEAGKKSADGKIIRQWSDTLGREWFEAENAKYHMTGYVMARGFDAWINYCGYRVNEPLEPAEFQLASKSLETILPLGAPVQKEQSASAK